MFFSDIMISIYLATALNHLSLIVTNYAYIMNILLFLWTTPPKSTHVLCDTLNLRFSTPNDRSSRSRLRLSIELHEILYIILASEENRCTLVYALRFDIQDTHFTRGSNTAGL